MQPELASEPFHLDGWVYEEKLDGWRMIAYKDGPRVRLVSRMGVDEPPRVSRRGRYVRTAMPTGAA
jgi:hypothetical protein